MATLTNLSKKCTSKPVSAVTGAGLLIKFGISGRQDLKQKPKIKDFVLKHPDDLLLHFKTDHHD